MIAESLKEARLTGVKKYWNDCPKHGRQAYAVLDNSCPRCVTDAHAIRRKTNYVYNRSREHFNEVKKRARERGIQFDITLEWVREQYDTVTTCPYLGIDLNSTQEEATARPDHNKSIDRVDSSKGCVVGNVVVCSSRANRIKNDATVEELEKMVHSLRQM